MGKGAAVQGLLILEEAPINAQHDPQPTGPSSLLSDLHYSGQAQELACAGPRRLAFGISMSAAARTRIWLALYKTRGGDPGRRDIPLEILTDLLE